MEKSGCYYIPLGIESGTQRILDLMNKNLRIEKIKKNVKLIKKYTKIKVGGFFILGYLTETKKEIRNTISFAKKLPLDFAHFYILGVEPGSEIYFKFKRRFKNTKSFFEIIKMWNKKRISSKKIKWLYWKSYLSFYLRPTIISDIITNIRLGALKFILTHLFFQKYISTSHFDPDKNNLS